MDDVSQVSGREGSGYIVTKLRSPNGTEFSNQVEDDGTPRLNDGSNPPIVSIPSYMNKKHLAAQASDNNFNLHGFIGLVFNSGTFTSSPETDSHYVNMETDNQAGSESGIDYGGLDQMRSQHNPTFYTKVKTAADIDNHRIWIGLNDSGFSNSDTYGTTANVIGFRFSTGASDTKWQFITGNGTTQTVTDSGVTVSANTVYDLKFRVDDAAGKVYFSINNGTEVEVTLTLPASTVDLGVGWALFNIGAGKESLKMSKLYTIFD